MDRKLKKVDIKSFSKSQLENWLEKIGEKKFRAKQVFKWVYQKQCDDFNSMTDLNQNLRNKLSNFFSINRLKIRSVQQSTDGSKKYAFLLYDNNIIESVLIPCKKYLTVCVSSQVGCSQKCQFCMTAKDGFTRNLSSDEIIAQIRDIKREVETKKNMPNMPLNNIVFMGMGEPLANYKHLTKAISTISNGDYGLKFSPRHITVSTAGLIPKIELLGTTSKVNLAISLNASTNRVRNILMPINKTYPIEALIETCNNYPLDKRRRITFEYVLINKINDSKNDAKRLASLLKNTKAKINLIPFNEHKNYQYKKPPMKKILTFQKHLLDMNYTAIIRKSKGSDISGGCGQLRSKYNKA